MTSDHLQTEQLYALMDGELLSAEKKELERHLGLCPLCQRRMSEIQSLFTEIESVPDVALTRDLSGSVVAELLARRGSTAALPFWLTLQGLIAAAVMAAWLVLQPNPIPAVSGFFDQVDLMIWWGRWVMPRLADLRLLLASLPDEAWQTLRAVELPQFWTPVSGLPWASVIIGSILLWLLGNGLLLGEGQNGGFPWKRIGIRKDSNHG